MSKIETILTRAMTEPEFADLIFADPEKALAEYKLSEDEMAEFKALINAEFEVLDAEGRRSMVSGANFMTLKFSPWRTRTG